MKKIILSLLSFVGTMLFSQWQPTVLSESQYTRKELKTAKNYTLDIEYLKKVLVNAPLENQNKKPVELRLPDAEGNMHRFFVYSRPVADEKLAKRYQLGSYVGRGIDDASLFIRFSLSGDDFQSMMIKNGEYQFIEPLNQDKSVYGVFHKTNKTQRGKAFECKTDENPKQQQEIENLFSKNNWLEEARNMQINSSDQKFRTYRLAVAVTAEYSRMFGGLAGALAQINATLTRVNGVFEKDLAISLILISNNDELVYTNPDTDPFTGVNNWSRELQILLSQKIGDDKYDIGHLFATEGGGGDAGCNGCICLNPSLDGNGVPQVGGKGSAYTGTAMGGRPQGDSYDIDLVAHEIGHQLGANHTFSHTVHQGSQYNVHMEPHKGTTIMGYGDSSDAYFHTASIDEILVNLRSKENCGTHINITNTPPRVTLLPNLSIPKGTAFMLKANATDNENDGLTYTWEQIDNATSAMSILLPEATSGPMFRSLKPSNSSERYFPNLATVLSGSLKTNTEAIPTVARDLNFRVTVRDNHPNTREQQLATASQKITVVDTAPFTVNSSVVYNNTETIITWNAGNTASAPFNAKNVKIDYTTDNGATWQTIIESTPNDGEEIVTFSSTLIKDSEIFIRVSAVENVFFAVNKAKVSEITLCNGDAPKGIDVSGISTNNAFLNWNLEKNATYKIRYKNPWATNWTEASTSVSPFEMTNLEENSLYEVQIATVCNGVEGAYGSVHQFFTLAEKKYCELIPNTAERDWISNVNVTPKNGLQIMNSSSGSMPTSSVSDYSQDTTRIVYLEKGSTDNTITVNVGRNGRVGYKREGALTIWIDFNGDGNYSDSERIMMSDRTEDTQFTKIFSVPEDAYSGDKLVGMRVVHKLAWQGVPAQGYPCGRLDNGEVENYSVKISKPKEVLSVKDLSESKAKIYPNPAKDWLYLQNIKPQSTYIIYNMSGQIVLQGKADNNSINISPLQKGNYIISIHNNKDKTNFRFIKY
ncbi:MAG: M12 family metallo-peptidase [Cruoricaptor ignavus]|nr:M12 family metallo-peptidase [Cruoricaptor ignavus]